MAEPAPSARPNWPVVMGSGLILIGLTLFLIVFLALYPVLSNPTGTYERWFPDSAAAADPPADAPLAGFEWEAATIAETEPPIIMVRLDDKSAEGGASITSWNWDLGDGRQAEGRSVVHTYDAPGSYAVRLTVQDAAGLGAVAGGTVTVPGDGIALGAAGSVEDLDLTGLESTLEVGPGSIGDSINATIDEAIGSVGSAARGIVVVVLFALSALATTVVAWRVARIGVMVLRPHTVGRGGGVRRRIADARGRTPLVQEEPLEEREPELV